MWHQWQSGKNKQVNITEEMVQNQILVFILDKAKHIRGEWKDFSTVL